MKKTILITGASDGIGLATAKILVSHGHTLLLHGRNREKLTKVQNELKILAKQSVGAIKNQHIEIYVADLSTFSEIKQLANEVKSAHNHIDVLINNAGVLKVAQPITSDGLDVRFMINTIAPYLLTQQLLPLLKPLARVLNLSSAAQAPVNIDALLGHKVLTDMQAYAESKLAITMWTNYLAEQYKNDGPTMIAVNPGSLLASKMVRESFGLAGNDITIGAKILVRMATEEGLEHYSGQYFDNDKGKFSLPHPDSENKQKAADIIHAIEDILRKH